MSPRLFGMLLVLVCAGIEALAQISFKQSTRSPARRLCWVAAGVGLFAVEAVVYTAALQRLDLSLAYALGAMSFVVVALGAAWLLGETLPIPRRVGILLIIAGCGLLASGQ